MLRRSRGGTGRRAGSRGRRARTRASAPRRARSRAEGSRGVHRARGQSCVPHRSTSNDGAIARARSDEQRGGVVELERREGPEHLARDHQRLAARREDAQLSAAADEVLDDLRGDRDDVLTVVEDQQRVTPAEELAQALAQVRSTHLLRTRPRPRARRRSRWRRPRHRQPARSRPCTRRVRTQ